MEWRPSGMKHRMQRTNFQLGDWLNSLFSWGYDSGPLVGLDVGHNAIKMVLLDTGTSSHQGLRLNRYSSQLLPKGAMRDGSILDEEAVSEAIRKAWTKLASPTNRVVFSMPNNMVLSRTVMLTESQMDDVEAIVESEVSGFVPFPVEEVSWDFAEISSGSTQGEHELIICAAKREKVEERLAVIEMAELEPSVATADSLGLFAALSGIEEYETGKVVAMFDLGTHKTSCMVVKNNRQIYYREQDFGGIRMNRDLQKRFGLNHDDAEVAKRDRVLPEGYETLVERPFALLWVEELDRLLQFFSNTISIEQGQRPDLLVLCGGGARLANIDEMVRKKTGVSTVVANPFRNMQHSSMRLRDLVYEAPLLSLACGLAMRKPV